jgi:uncharacterized protein
MTLFKYTIIILSLILTIVFVLSCNQEKLIFYPEKLPADYLFKFAAPFQEINIRVDKKTTINGLLFKAESSKGLVFYLHGNAGSNRSWGEIADVYLANHYDFFIVDYRGYGKSQGKIESEKQFLNDVTLAYDSMKKLYAEKDIVIIGYSIGTGSAAYLASTQNPGLLILKAPYYNLPDLAKHYLPIVPKVLIHYKFRTDQFIQKVKCPIVIFHGDADEIIYTGSSYKLQKLFKPGDRLIILKGQTHNGINYNSDYLRELKNILN